MAFRNGKATCILCGTGGGGGASSPPASIEVEIPVVGEDIYWFKTFLETTVLSLDFVLKGSGGQSLTVTVRFAADRSAVGTELLAGGRVITSITTGQSFVPDVGTIPAGNFVWIETTATAGAVTELGISLDRTQ